MIEAFATARNRTVALVFLAVGCLAAVAAAIVGISDNPPGILLALLAAVAGVLVFVHPWRRARQFVLLFYAAGLGFAVFAVVHNVAEVVAGKVTWAPLHLLLQALNVGAFLLAILVCPPALVVGVVGALVMLVRSRLRRRPSPDAPA